MTGAAATFAEGHLPGVSPAIYGNADFRAISDMVHTAAGIVLNENKAMLVYSRVAPLVRESSFATFGEFIADMRHNEPLRRRVIDALTTNHTFFFRENHHFEHFASEVRPMLAAQLEAGKQVRLWSAGCSSGEETWSLVLTLLGEDRALGRQLARRDVRVLASDIARPVLQRASAAGYAETETREIPEALRRNWTASDGQTVTIGAEARGIVRFRELNLLGDWPMRHPFDAIFCRNVMIYFDAETKERLVARLVDQLRPGGHLYIGHSERANGPAATQLEPVGPTIYRKRAA